MARAALFGDAMVVPDADHVVDMVTCAKRDLKAGESLDGISFYMTYGVCERTPTSPSVSGCAYDDVDLPAGRLIDKLRAEQTDATAALS